ncbi:MAG: M15 family metallopeptidase [Rhizobiaceae bacterium]|nr:M15 family metallopeptidase [Rhizobiaceae bacterium]
MLIFWSIVPAFGTPDGFVHLRMVDKTIVQDIRYTTRNNFVGKPLSGYQAGECILARPVAKALGNAQKRLKPLGLGLLVYDCYRPARAVRAMVRAVQANKKPNVLYHPNIPANLLIKKGYVASRSGHSNGGSVDLTLVYLEDGKPLDMGTRFDFFDPASHTRSNRISKKAAKNRRLLAETMARAGFSNYKREWWHFRFIKEPYRGRHFDFPITSP